MSTIPENEGEAQARWSDPSTVLRHVVCVIVLFDAVVPTGAQTTLGTIRGAVVDQQQNIVPGASAVVADETTNVTREARTDEPEHVPRSRAVVVLAQQQRELGEGDALNQVWRHLHT